MNHAKRTYLGASGKLLVKTSQYCSVNPEGRVEFPIKSHLEGRFLWRPFPSRDDGVSSAGATRLSVFLGLLLSVCIPKLVQLPSMMAIWALSASGMLFWSPVTL